MLGMKDVHLNGKRVLLRADFNVPITEGKITSTARIEAGLASIRFALSQGARVMVTSHLGRPKEGVFDEALSLAPVAQALSAQLQMPVRLLRNWLTEPFTVAEGEVVLLENCRFHVGELGNDQDLARRYSALCDVFVMDAFATAHRAEASTSGVAHFAPVACAGLLLQSELDALTRALATPKRPLLAIVGGSKVSTKLALLKNLLPKVDTLIVGGGIANTFLYAQGKPIGRSLYEPDLVAEAKRLLGEFDAIKLPLPQEVVCGKAFAADTPATVKAIEAVAEDDLILDIGPNFSQELSQAIAQAGTIVWNGPVGVFEFPSFANGTRTLAHAIAQSSAFSLAGGGDTIAAIEAFGVTNDISYISTGGGAFLAFLEGQTLPAVAALNARAS